MAVASHITAILLTVSVMRSSAAGPPTAWVKAGSGAQQMCAGATDACTSVETCTYHAYGPCGGASTPPIYIEGSITALAVIEGGSEAYLSDDTKITQLTPSPVVNNGYKGSEGDLTVTDSNGATIATYARMTAGAFYGSDPMVSGGFLGMAAYILQTGTLQTKMNNVDIPTAVGSATTSSQEVCIAELTAGACGTEITYTAGDYKFSLFGYTTGSNFQVDPAVTHVGFRTKMKLVGAAADLTINGDKTLSTIGTADVASITVTEQGGAKKQQTITFPNKYNTGPKSNLLVPQATKTVKIKVSDTGLGDQSIYVDYLFEKLTAADEYFIYDPDVRETTPSAHSASSAYHVAVFIPLVIAFVSGLVHF